MPMLMDNIKGGSFHSKSDFDVLRILGWDWGKLYSVAHVRRRTNYYTEYALKEFNLTAISQSMGTSRIVELIHHEYDTLKLFDHPNIIRTFGAFEETIDASSYFFIITEFCDGGDLEQTIQKASEPFPEWQIQSWTGQLATALEFMHSKGYIHCGVKAENIFLSSNGRYLKLGDFLGARKVEVATKNNKSRDYHLFSVVPKFFNDPDFPCDYAYVAPEIIEDKGLTTKYDIWSLGIVVYELANFKRPFGEDGRRYRANITPTTILKSPPAPFVETTSYSTDLRDCVFSMLEKEPNRRPSVQLLLKSAFLTKELIAQPTSTSPSSKSTSSSDESPKVEAEGKLQNLLQKISMLNEELEPDRQIICRLEQQLEHGQILAVKSENGRAQ